MENRDVMLKFRKRLAVEGILKAVALAVVTGLITAFVIAFTTWFSTFNGLWLAIGALFLVSAVMTPFFYFLLFVPTERKVAERVDRAGLEERLITMLDYSNDDSFMAFRQRADAEHAAMVMDSKGIDPIAATSRGVGASVLSRSVFITLMVSMAVAIAMIVITGLSAYGILPNGAKVLAAAFDGPAYYSVTYTAGEGGAVYDAYGSPDEDIYSAYAGARNAAEDGTETSSVVYSVSESGSAPTVIATPFEGYYFVYWVDADGNVYSSDPSINVSRVSKDESLGAVFAELDVPRDDPYGNGSDSNSDEGSDKKNSREDGDYDEDRPPEDEKSEGDGGDGPGAGDDGYENVNDSIIDGKTNYKENYGDYHEDAMGNLSDSSEGLPPSLVDYIEAYFEGLL